MRKNKELERDLGSVGSKSALAAKPAPDQWPAAGVAGGAIAVGHLSSSRIATTAPRRAREGLSWKLPMACHEPTFGNHSAKVRVVPRTAFPDRLRVAYGRGFH